MLWSCGLLSVASAASLCVAPEAIQESMLVDEVAHVWALVLQKRDLCSRPAVSVRQGTTRLGCVVEPLKLSNDCTGPCPTIDEYIQDAETYRHMGCDGDGWVAPDMEKLEFDHKGSFNDMCFFSLWTRDLEVIRRFCGPAKAKTTTTTPPTTTTTPKPTLPPLEPTEWTSVSDTLVRRVPQQSTSKASHEGVNVTGVAIGVVGAIGGVAIAATAIYKCAGRSRSRLTVTPSSLRPEFDSRSMSTSLSDDESVQPNSSVTSDVHSPEPPFNSPIRTPRALDIEEGWVDLHNESQPQLSADMSSDQECWVCFK